MSTRPSGRTLGAPLPGRRTIRARIGLDECTRFRRVHGLGRRGRIAWIARHEETESSFRKPTSNDVRQDEAAANTHPLDGIEALARIIHLPGGEWREARERRAHAGSHTRDGL